MSSNPLYARISVLSIAPLTASEAEQWCSSRFISATEGERIWREASGDERRADAIWQNADWWTDRLNPTTVAEACELIWAEHERTGGTCTALVVRLREDFEIVITSAARPTCAPDTLDEAVVVCSHEHGELIEELRYPTLLAAVLEIYGPISA